MTTGTCLYLNSYFCLLGVVGAAHPWSAIQGNRGLPSSLAGGRERGGKSWPLPREERESNLLQGLNYVFLFARKQYIIQIAARMKYDDCIRWKVLSRITIRKKIERSKFIVINFYCLVTPPCPLPKKKENKRGFKYICTYTLNINFTVTRVTWSVFYMYICMFIAKNFNVLKNIVSLILSLLKCGNRWISCCKKTAFIIIHE